MKDYGAHKESKVHQIHCLGYVRDRLFGISLIFISQSVGLAD